MGLFAGFFLARAGKALVILERGEPWSEGSGVNAGSLGVQNKRPPMIPLALEAVRIWQGFQGESGKDVGYVRCGGLRVATTDEDVKALRDAQTLLQQRGLETEWLEGSALRSRAPWLGPSIQAGTFCPIDGFANPLIAGNALLESVSEAGGSVIPRAEVQGIRREDDHFFLKTSRGDISCHRIVIAAGAWSKEIARWLGFELPMRLGVNMLTVTEPVPKVMNLMVTHIRGILTLKQFPHGSCIIGGAWQGQGDLQSRRKDIDYEALLHNIRFAAAVVPGLANVHILRSWAGFEDVSPDYLPYFGRLPGYPNVFIMCGAIGGWTFAPALGRLMMDLLLTGKTSIPVREFAPERFIQ